jgi:death-on-curing family protein
MSEVARVTEDEVLRIRRQLATIDLGRASTFGTPEPIFPDRLSSAVARQSTSIGQVLKYTRLPDVAATLFYGIAMAHAFENGNKRTAMMSLFVLLDKNRHVLVNTSENDLYSFAEDVADHRFPIPRNLDRDMDSEVLGVASWIRSRIEPILAGDKHTRFSKLREHLEALGCTFDKPDKNYVKIHNGPHSVVTGRPRPDFEVTVNEVKKIRRSLHLDASHGVDTRGFYDVETRVNRFVEQHTNLMRRLANI